MLVMLQDFKKKSLGKLGGGATSARLSVGKWGFC